MNVLEIMGRMLMFSLFFIYIILIVLNYVNLTNNNKIHYYKLYLNFTHTSCLSFLFETLEVTEYSIRIII
jgi:hypothetical protein